MMDEPSRDFKVIGCGLPRTGTMSLKAALELLLDGPCHHANTISTESGHTFLDFWVNYWDNRDSNSPRLIREFLTSKGFVAGLDSPISFWYKDMMEAFPEAKVILTVRDFDGWYKSICMLNDLHKKILRWPTTWMIWFSGKGKIFYLMRDQCGAAMYDALDGGEDSSRKYHANWDKGVKLYIPKKNLLVFDVREGWEPLCKFLDVPVPNVPFPRLNDTASMKRFTNKAIYKSWFSTLAIVSIFVLLSSLLIVLVWDGLPRW